MFKFRLPIGDTSGDGHGICDWFIIGSAVPLSEVRKSYKNIYTKLGVRLDSSGGRNKNVPCADYEDNLLSISWLEKAQLLEHYKEKWKIKEGDEYIRVEVKDFVDLFLVFMNTHDSSLKLELIDADLESFSGSRKLDKLGYIGYGLLG